MKKIFNIILLVLVLPVLISQKNPINGDKPYVEGQVMIKFYSDLPQNQQQMLAELLFDFQSVELASVQKLSDRLDIFLLSFNPSLVDDNRLLDDIKGHPYVELAQFNHFISQRDLIPSDNYFALQWNMHNTGQSGGQDDADIDGPEAWGIGTSGVTALGDSIIIAIVDDGFDLEHGDLQFFKNRNEIPNNNIDDDGNGYIDDYDGWNAYNSSGDLIVKDHGTHVTGIAAARGNNGIGVTGVNLNVKVLPVAGSGTLESLVVSSYAYVLEMRASYNETDGAKGAFVVSTNSSFGVDAGWPENYPIWGAMYDSMGMQGILSAAATANANWDVDVIGDIPTTFPSDFLISVTNTDKFDEKSLYAGYGAISIDLGAPGTQVWSTRMNNDYGYKTGTSMSSPHVAGAVAYLFSVADEDFLTNYHNDPAGGALVIKEYIMNGVDPLPTLQGITVTGGRLNINNSAMLMLNPDVTFDPLSVLEVMLPNHQDSTTLSFTNNFGSNLNYYFTNPDGLNWLSLSGPVSGTLTPFATGAIKLHFNSNGYPADTLFTYLEFNYGSDGLVNIPVHLFVDPDVGTEEHGGMEAWRNGGMEVFPNPASEVLSVMFSGLSKETGNEIYFYDLGGRMVKELGIPFNRDETKIYVGDLNPGIYSVVLRNGSDFISAQKLIIAH